MEEFAVYNAAVQLIGFLGMALCVSCFLCKDSGKLLLLQLLGNSLFIVQFLLLGAYSGCATVVVQVSSSLCMVFRLRGAKWADWPGWPWLWSALTVVICAVTWAGWTSLLPCVSTIAFLQINWTGNANWIRLGKLTVVGLGWMAYDWLAGSYGGVVSEAIGCCSALVSLIYYWRQTRAAKANLDEKGEMTDGR
jgi:hypothetical protein